MRLKAGIDDTTLRPPNEKVRPAIERPPVNEPAETGVNAALNVIELPGATTMGKAGNPVSENPIPEIVMAGIVTGLAEVMGFKTLNVSTALAPLPGTTWPKGIGVAACGSVLVPVELVYEICSASILATIMPAPCIG